MARGSRRTNIMNPKSQDLYSDVGDNYGRSLNLSASHFLNSLIMCLQHGCDRLLCANVSRQGAQTSFKHQAGPTLRVLIKYQCANMASVWLFSCLATPSSECAGTSVRIYCQINLHAASNARQSKESRFPNSRFITS